MIDRNHPAVEAADRAAIRWMEDRELETDLGGTAYMLTAALVLPARAGISPSGCRTR